MPKPKLSKTEVAREEALPDGRFPPLDEPRADGATLISERTRCVLRRATGEEHVVCERDLPLTGEKGFVFGAFVSTGEILVTTGDGVELHDDMGSRIARLEAPAGLALWQVCPIEDGNPFVARAVGKLFFGLRDGGRLVPLATMPMPREGNFTIAGGHVYFSRDMSLGSKRWWRVDGVSALAAWCLAK